jgi:hypothetical protein
MNERKRLQEDRDKRKEQWEAEDKFLEGRLRSIQMHINKKMTQKQHENYIFHTK